MAAGGAVMVKAVMALIPYEHLPPPHDSPISVSGLPVQEYYCGDARCDCATAHVLCGGVPMTVDLGTTSVELVENRQSSPAIESLQQALRATLREGAIGKLRSHYAAVREYGKEQHFRYVDWTGVKAGEVVAWEQIFRTESTPMWTMTPGKPGEAEGDKEGDKPQAQSFLLGMADAYCIEPRCDCNRVVWTVVTAPVGRPERHQTLGTVELSFANGTPAVLRHSQGVDPNQLFMLVLNLLRSQPQLADMYKQRYDLLRQHITPLLQAQRRQKSEAHRQPTAGRNDPCPCGSGKKFKKCHGA